MCMGSGERLKSLGMMGFMLCMVLSVARVESIQQNTTDGFAVTAVPRWMEEKRMPDWISVKDRLPEDLRFVLAYIRHKKTPYDQYRDIRIMLRLEKYGWLHLEERSEVTHWMPLPKAPKEE